MGFIVLLPNNFLNHYENVPLLLQEHELPAKVENETADPDSTVGLLDITPGPCVTVRVDTSTLSLVRNIIILKTT